MIPNWLLDLTVGNRLVRKVANLLLSGYSRLRANRLDRMPPAWVQRATLRRLLRQGRRTKFGRDHDFDNIHSVADYQARVPLRTYEDFWRDYWQRVFPRLRGVTWPQRIPYYALSSGTTTGATKYLPITRQMIRSNTHAALTTLALFLRHRPQADLLGGKFFFLGGSTSLVELKDGSFSGDLSGIAAATASPLMRPYTYPPPEIGLLGDWDKKVVLLAEQTAKLPITAISGVPAWILTLFEHLRRVTGKKTIAEIWPRLCLVIHGGARFEPYRKVFREVVGSDAVTFQDTYPASEGYVATEDPRYGMLRLLPDHGIFFEFVPVDELESNKPTRHTVETLEVGQRYAVVMTTCAGLWSYVLGDTVEFERRNPPLLRFTGRTKDFLSAFGEHLILEEVQTAIERAAEATGATLAGDWHVGPVFPESSTQPGFHRYFVEFTCAPHDLAAFTRELDRQLHELNKDYVAYRIGDVSLAMPEVVPVPSEGFAKWMRSRGKLGGQNKVPRMDNTGRLTRELEEFLAQTQTPAR